MIKDLLGKSLLIILCLFCLSSTTSIYLNANDEYVVSDSPSGGFLADIEKEVEQDEDIALEGWWNWSIYQAGQVFDRYKKSTVLVMGTALITILVIRPDLAKKTVTMPAELAKIGAEKAWSGIKTTGSGIKTGAGKVWGGMKTGASKMISCFKKKKDPGNETPGNPALNKKEEAEKDK